MKPDIVLNILPNLNTNIKSYRCRSPLSGDESSDDEINHQSIEYKNRSQSIHLIQNKSDDIHSDSLYVYKPRRITPCEASCATSDEEEQHSVKKRHRRKKPVKIILYNKEILGTLNTYGYHIKDIIKAMKFIVNPNDINEIMHRLDINGKTSSASLNLKPVQIEPLPLITTHSQKMAVNRMHIEREILSSESTYCECLDKLLNGLIYPMFDGRYLRKKYRIQIISSLPEILKLHQHFLSQLNCVHIGHKSVANIFNECIVFNKERFIEIYIEFIRDYKPICDLFTDHLKGNKKLNRFLQSKEISIHQLPSFFILPVQRVPRYILLLADLRKNTKEDSMEYKEIDDAVAEIKDITEEINERLSQCLSTKRQVKKVEDPRRKKALKKMKSDKMLMNELKNKMNEIHEDNDEDQDKKKKDDDDDDDDGIDVDIDPNDIMNTERYVERFGFQFTLFSLIFIILFYLRFSYLFFSNYLLLL